MSEIQSSINKAVLNEEYTNEFFIDKTVYERFVEFTRRYSYTEWGGGLLGNFTESGAFKASVAILPPQTTQNSIYCEFKREFFLALSRMRENLENQGFKESEIPQFGCWIHTHPNLTAFLSGTDLDTFSYLVSLNPLLTAVVIDPVQKHELCVNSQKDEKNGFKEIVIQHLEFDHTDKSKKLFEAIIKEVNSTYFSNLLGVKQSIKVFTPIGEFECLHELLESKFASLEEKFNKSDNKILIYENQFHEHHQIIAHIPALKKIDFSRSEYISNYRVFETGILINQLKLNKNPYSKFTKWEKIISISLLNEVSSSNKLLHALEFKFILRKNMLLKEEKYFVFFSREPEEFTLILTQFVGEINKLKILKAPKPKEIKSKTISKATTKNSKQKDIKEQEKSTKNKKKPISTNDKENTIKNTKETNNINKEIAEKETESLIEESGKEKTELEKKVS